MADEKGIVRRTRDELEDENSALRKRMERLKGGVEKRLEAVEELAVGSVVCFGMGALQHRAEMQGTSLPTVMGMDPKLVYGAGAYLVGREVKGQAGVFLRAGGQALVNVYAYDAGHRSAMLDATTGPNPGATGGGAGITGPAAGTQSHAGGQAPARP